MPLILICCHPSATTIDFKQNIYLILLLTLESKVSFTSLIRNWFSFFSWICFDFFFFFTYLFFRCHIVLNYANYLFFIVKNAVLDLAWLVTWAQRHANPFHFCIGVGVISNLKDIKNVGISSMFSGCVLCTRWGENHWIIYRSIESLWNKLGYMWLREKKISILDESRMMEES